MTAPVRERPVGAVHASPTAGQARREAARRVLASLLIPAVLVGAFLSFVGAFGTRDMPLPLRTLFMVAISAVATLLGFLTFRVTGRLAWTRGAYWRHGLAAAVVMAVPMGLVVWSAVNLVAPAGHGPAIRNIPDYLVVSLITSAFFCLFVAWARRNDGRAAQPDAPVPPRFLERLPLKLRGAEVWAVEAEDHYLRLHTSKGQDLILMRLADAVAELEGIEGLQVHRSWWVAREAIVDARRGDGRATLTLKDGAQVPVSRTYAGELRARGWI
ncbi:LytTR family DNA-binding domain-containing protein [Phenylobacterium sp.]|uniref:LytTR family DNA-binding domain-containing protein n=1 Tax=Phenylobacterium sp. TaxID=1871053 RepID=UPI003918B87B